MSKTSLDSLFRDSKDLRCIKSILRSLWRVSEYSTISNIPFNKKKYFLHNWHLNFQGSNKYSRLLLCITVSNVRQEDEFEFTQNWLSIWLSHRIQTSIYFYRLSFYSRDLRSQSDSLYIFSILSDICLGHQTLILYLTVCDLSYTEYSFSSRKFPQFKEGVHHVTGYRMRVHFTQKVHKTIFNNYTQQNTLKSLFSRYSFSHHIRVLNIIVRHFSTIQSDL